MIQEHVKRKFIITTLALIIFLITLTFPNVEEDIKNVSISYTKDNNFPIYLLNHESYVSRTNMVMKTEETIDLVKEILEILTIQNNKNAYIPSLFEPVIPKDTKILSLDIQEDVLKINFSKEFLNITKEYEEKMIECIVYSLTEIENINGIILFVEGSVLDKLPSSKTPLPPLLTRDIGVNKIYNINSLKNVNKTTTYYIAKNDNYSYYIPVTLLDNNEKDKIEIIIERLKSYPNIHTNLISYLNASTELTDYELVEKEVILSFSPFLYEGIHQDEILEEVKYSISLSIKDTLNVEEVSFIEGQ